MKLNIPKEILNKLMFSLNIKIVNSEHYSTILHYFEMGLILQRLYKIELANNLKRHIVENFEKSYSQLFQDLIVDYILKNSNVAHGRVFVEFGATNGIKLSNSKYFEENGWQGVLAEPAKIYHSSLIKNRSCKLILKAVGIEDASGVDFIETYEGALSSRANWLNSDSHALWRNSMIRRKYKVDQIGINNLLNLTQAPVTYLSIDIEGGEYELLPSLS